jgi:hypothetical protein
MRPCSGEGPTVAWNGPPQSRGRRGEGPNTATGRAPCSLKPAYGAVVRSQWKAERGCLCRPAEDRQRPAAHPPGAATQGQLRANPLELTDTTDTIPRLGDVQVCDVFAADQEAEMRMRCVRLGRCNTAGCGCIATILVLAPVQPLQEDR